jgi:acetyl esterase/lipase
MKDSKIPKYLLEKYNIYKEDNLKFAPFKIDNFEKEYIDKDNSMAEALNAMKQSLEKIYEQLSEIIVNNKNTFNDICSENGIKSLDYLLITKTSIYFLSQIISKLEKKELENETFESICSKIFPNFQKISDIQYPKGDNTSDMANVEKFVNSILEFVTVIKNATNSPGMMLTILVRYLDIKLIPVVNSSLEKFKEIKEFKDSSFFNNQTKAHEMILFDLLASLKSIKIMNEFIYFAFMLDENELVNKSEQSEEWTIIKKYLWTVKPKNLDVEKIAEELGKKMEMRRFQMMKMRDQGVFGKIGGIFNNLFGSGQNEYEFKKSKIKLYDSETMINFMAGYKKLNPMMKKLVLGRLPSIVCRRKLYLKRVYKPIDLEYIIALNDFLNGKEIEPKDKNISLFENYKLPKELAEKKVISQKVEKNEKDFYVSTRLLNNSQLLFVDENPDHKNEFKNTLIIHFNGGPFKLNINSLMNEKFLRAWSTELGAAVLMIKKPEKDEDNFPAILNQYFQAYMCLMDNAKSLLNMDIKKIIISGDSSGGYCAMAFTNLLIGINLFEKKDIRIPDLLLLEYPNFSWELNRSSVSMSLGATNNFMTHDLFKTFVHNYLGEYRDYRNMFVSPLYTSDKVLEHMPIIRIFFGDKDTGRDEFLRGIYRFRNCKDIRAYNFLELPHAFNGIEQPELYEMVKDFIIEEVKQVLQ